MPKYSQSDIKMGKLLFETFYETTSSLGMGEWEDTEGKAVWVDGQLDFMDQAKRFLKKVANA